MLLLACACNNGDDATVGDPTDAPASDNENSDKNNDGTDKPLLDTDIWLSDVNAPVRIVYGEGAKGAAVRVYDRLTALDSKFTMGKYSTVKDSVAADGTPEIILGDTNRAATAEAKKLITESGDFYSIYVSGNSIAVYSAEPEGIESGAADLISKIGKKGRAVMEACTSISVCPHDAAYFSKKSAIIVATPQR